MGVEAGVLGRAGHARPVASAFVLDVGARARIAPPLGETIVHHVDGLARPIEQKVVRLDVAVQPPARVHVLQIAQDVAPDVHHGFDSQAARRLAAHVVVEADAEQGHDQHVDALSVPGRGRTAPQHGRDAGTASERGKHDGLVAQAAYAVLALFHLDGDAQPVRVGHVDGLVDDAKAAAAGHAPQCKPVGDDRARLQAIARIARVACGRALGRHGGHKRRRLAGRDGVRVGSGHGGSRLDGIGRERDGRRRGRRRGRTR